MNNQIFTIVVLMMTTLVVYLFVDAPPRLPERATAEAVIPVSAIMTVAEAENDVVRKLYTEAIVGAGKKVGLNFNEDWRQDGIEAGPLPALFLRETSACLEKKPVRLSLFLGSDFPINTANRFEGRQMEIFKVLKETKEPQFFYSEDTGLHMAMFPDFATVSPCIDCHNAHEKSPKRDWQLNDVMGATTWSYPKEFVSLDEAMSVLAALRVSFGETYLTYLSKTKCFQKQPEIGEQWPRDGYFLPTKDVFLGEAFSRSSAHTLEVIISAANADGSAE